MLMNEKLDDYSDLVEFNQEQKDSKIEKLKDVLSPLAQKLKKLDSEKENTEIKLNEINKTIADIQSKIRSLWGPYISGAEKASINCHGIIIETKPTLNVRVDKENDYDECGSRDKAIQWLMENDYKDIMKWDCNTNKMYKIARD